MKGISKPKTEAQLKKRHYKKICFKDTLYHVGETLLFKETETSNIIGRLVRIIPEGGNPLHPKWPMLEVQWFYKKQDLDFKKLGIAPEDLRYIGDNEVFLTNHFDKIYPDSINGRCRVYPIMEYDELNNVDNLTYFTRANYSPLQKTLDPPMKDWDRYCVCNKPLNPNLFFIKCDQCNKWFHPECMGLTEEQAQEKEEFHCVVCSNAV